MVQVEAEVTPQAIIVVVTTFVAQVAVVVVVVLTLENKLAVLVV
jgi:hypothetical protein